MELRITSVFNPLSKALGFFLSELGVSPTAVAFSSFIAAILSALLFVFSFNLPLISVRTALIFAVLLIFLNALLDDVERRIETRKKKKSVFGGPLGTFLGQLSDIFIIFGALIFLAIRDTYYDFGRFLFLNFSYVEPGLYSYMLLGGLTLLGILIIRYIASRKKEKGLGLWIRSERMYLFGGFALYGIISGLFSGVLYTGTLILTLMVYVSIFRRVVKTPRPSKRPHRFSYKTSRLVKNGFVSIINIFKAIIRGFLRIIGVVLLGIYLGLEKLYLGILKGFRGLKKIRVPKRTIKPKPSTKHPPIKPFEGTIAPPPSTLPAESEKPYDFPQNDERVEIESSVEDKEEAELHEGEGVEETPEQEMPTIELPPPEHLLESDTSYTGSGEVAESMLVEYDPSAKKEDVLIDIVEFMVGEGKDIVIVTNQPATTHYRERFKEVQGIRVIDLPDQAIIPNKDEIPMTNLEYFSEVFEDLANQNIFIFEPLSNLILHIGVAQSYRFVSQTMNRLSKKGVTLIVFMNKEGHDKKDISNFENLFMNIAGIDDGKLKKVR
jgi:hypothetical protein